MVKKPLKPKYTEHKGFKLGQAVKLKGVQMPGGEGRITRVFLDKSAGEKGKGEMAFDVLIDGERWYPIYLDELERT